MSTAILSLPVWIAAIAGIIFIPTVLRYRMS